MKSRGWRRKSPAKAMAGGPAGWPMHVATIRKRGNEIEENTDVSQ